MGWNTLYQLPEVGKQKKKMVFGRRKVSQTWGFLEGGTERLTPRDVHPNLLFFGGRRGPFGAVKPRERLSFL